MKFNQALFTIIVTILFLSSSYLYSQSIKYLEMEILPGKNVVMRYNNDQYVLFDSLGNQIWEKTFYTGGNCMKCLGSSIGEVFIDFYSENNDPKIIVLTNTGFNQYSLEGLREGQSLITVEDWTIKSLWVTYVGFERAITSSYVESETDSNAFGSTQFSIYLTKLKFHAFMDHQDILCTLVAPTSSISPVSISSSVDLSQPLLTNYLQSGNYEFVYTPKENLEHYHLFNSENCSININKIDGRNLNGFIYFNDQDFYSLTPYGIQNEEGKYVHATIAKYGIQYGKNYLLIDENDQLKIFDINWKEKFTFDLSKTNATLVGFDYYENELVLAYNTGSELSMKRLILMGEEFCGDGMLNGEEIINDTLIVIEDFAHRTTFKYICGLSEVPYNGIDDDCNPETLDDDLDGDGYSFAEDCNDQISNVNPGQQEILNNGVDDDCNPETKDYKSLIPCDISGNVILNNEKDYLDFKSSYDGCLLTINGNLEVNIKNGVHPFLDLNGIVSVDGHILIQESFFEEISLINLIEISELKLSMLPNLDSIFLNESLNSLVINIQHTNLSNCSITAICNHVSSEKEIIIIDNHGDCENLNLVVEQCGLIPDEDNDGFNLLEDCDDTNPLIYPGQPEIINNGIDDDCNPDTDDLGENCIIINGPIIIKDIESYLIFYNNYKNCNNVIIKGTLRIGNDLSPNPEQILEHLDLSFITKVSNLSIYGYVKSIDLSNLTHIASSAFARPGGIFAEGDLPINLTNIDISKLRYVGGSIFVSNGEPLQEIEEVGKEYSHDFSFNSAKDSMVFPALKKAQRLVFKNSSNHKHLDLPNLNSIKEFYLLNNDSLETINIPDIPIEDRLFIKNNDMLSIDGVPHFCKNFLSAIKNNISSNGIGLANINESTFFCTCSEDLDDDGVINYFDCNDEDPLINPNILEVIGNEIDDDCNDLTNDDGSCNIFESVFINDEEAYYKFYNNYINCHVHIKGDLTISVDEIQNHDFSFVRSVSGVLIFKDHDITKSVNLSNIEYAGIFTIQDNNLLEDVHLNQNMIIINQVNIYRNPNLSFCNILPLCNALQSGISNTIFDNDIDCNSLDEVLLNCGQIDDDNDGSFIPYDCDDSNPLVNPEMIEVINNNIDDDCDETTNDDGSCFVGDIEIKTLSEYNAFVQKYKDCLLTIDGDLTIRNLGSLDNLDCINLNFIISISSKVTIRNLGILRKVEFLNLASLAILEIIGNVQLQNLIFNDNLIIHDQIILDSNSSLFDCNNEAICTFLQNGGIHTISNNLAGCNEVIEVLNACGPIDQDSDGFILPFDCDDSNPSINPDAIEVIGNDIDDDCDELTSDDGSCISISTVSITNIEEYNAFVELYKNCQLHIEGSLFISDIEIDTIDLPFFRSTTISLAIENIKSLKTIKLNNLRTLGRDFILNKNESLSELILSPILIVEGKISIRQNLLLSTCNLPSICAHIQNDGSVSISNNNSGCNNYNEVLLACSIDADNDGSILPFDCDDYNSLVNPDMEEVIDNGIDDDCNESTTDDGTCIIEGNINLHSIEAYNAFVASYKDCPVIINGNLSISDFELETIDLNFIYSISGNFDLLGMQMSTTLNIQNLYQVEELSIRGNLTINTLLLNPSLGILDLIEITNNPNLSDCNQIAICNHLQSGKTAIISLNLQGCNNIDEVILSCDPVDEDNDGSILPYDCDDNNPMINPDMEEIIGNGIDDDCNDTTNDDGTCVLELSTISISSLPEYHDFIQTYEDCQLIIKGSLNIYSFDIDTLNFGFIKSISGSLIISSITSLTIIQLPILQEIGEGLSIRLNKNLSELNFNQDLIIKESLILLSNTSLSTCNQMAICSGIQNVVTVFIDQNKFGCNNKDEILLSCSFMDGDNDGSILPFDCDDTDPNVNPNMEEILGNGIDDDCDATTGDIVGVNDLYELGVNIFPNPVEDILIIENENAEKIIIRIYDIQGNLVNSFPTQETRIPINLSTNNDGVYILKVNVGSQSLFVKVVKL